MGMVRYDRNDDVQTRLAVFGPIIRHIECAPITGRNRILEVPSAFDTEVSSFYDESDGEESAIVYVWMFGVCDTVVYGRTLEDFHEFIYILQDYLEKHNQRLITYVHNLKYDFAFIRKLFHWDNVFMKHNRDPLYARLPFIEFRDSLVLSGGKSLAYIGDHLKSGRYKKAVGNLDYQLLRCSITPLTDKELYYCEMDIRVLEEFISEKMEEEGSITKIPYTNTGYVRRYVKQACFGKNPERYRQIIDGLTVTPGAYQQAERAFMGGAVGPDIKKIGKIWENVSSYDIKSSYPYVMATGYFPMSFGHPVKNKDARDLLCAQQVCCIFKLTVFDLLPKTDYCFPISESKCINLQGAVTASGRVISAGFMQIMCTELDYDTFCKFYDINEKNSRIENMRWYAKGRLPTAIITSVFEFFNKKTTLDGVVGREAEYMLSKNMLNSIYGMMVEKPVRPIYRYDEDSGLFKKDEADYVEQIERYNNKWDRFLFYPWGVYVTAQARHRLYDAIYNVGEDFVYCDTDSVKMLGAQHQDYFDRVNEEARNEIRRVSQELNLSLDWTVPRSPDGVQKWLGVWEHEWTADKFKTLGAKRYMYQVGDNIKLVTAGTNQKGTTEYITTKFPDPFDAFSENLVVPEEYAKRIVATFIDKERSGWLTDYMGNRYYYDVDCGIHMKPSTYSYSITDEIKRAMTYAFCSGEEEQGYIE